jgi:hypothetical protein
MIAKNTTSKFPLGQLVATPGALDALAESGQSPAEFLARHVRGDRGDVCDEDKQLNDMTVVRGERLLSASSIPCLAPSVTIFKATLRAVLLGRASCIGISCQVRPGAKALSRPRRFQLLVRQGGDEASTVA